MDDETTPRGGGLGRLFSGSRARLLLIGGGVIALFLLIRHYAQNVTPAASSGAPPLGTGTTIYEPTILSGGGTSGGTSGAPVSLGSDVGVGTQVLHQHQRQHQPVGSSFSFAQWMAEIRQFGGRGTQHPYWAGLIQQDQNLTPQQRGQLLEGIGGGPAPRGAQHPAGSAAERVAPILPGYAGGH